MEFYLLSGAAGIGMAGNVLLGTVGAGIGAGVGHKVFGKDDPDGNSGDDNGNDEGGPTNKAAKETTTTTEAVECEEDTDEKRQQ